MWPSSAAATLVPALRLVVLPARIENSNVIIISAAGGAFACMDSLWCCAKAPDGKLRCGQGEHGDGVVTAQAVLSRS